MSDAIQANAPDGGRHGFAADDGPVLLIGAGRAGRALATALSHAGLTVRLHGRATPSGQGGLVASGNVGDRPAARIVRSDDPAGALPADVGRASVIIVCVRDEQLDGVVASLTQAAADGRLGAGTAVLQLSGSGEPASLERLRAAGRPAGTFHPLLPLTAESAPSVFRGAWVGIDGDDAAVDVARGLAGLLGARWLRIPVGARAVYHAAAVIASNFPVVLAALAARLLRDAGVEPAEADGAVSALLSAAAANVSGGDLDAATVAHRLTGPLSRGDAATVAAHRRALAADPATLAVYDSLSLAALDVLRAGGIDPHRLAPIAEVLRTG